MTDLLTQAWKRERAAISELYEVLEILGGDLMPSMATLPEIVSRVKIAAQKSVKADVLPAPACCASFVAYGVHHEDCRNNPERL